MKSLPTITLLVGCAVFSLFVYPPPLPAQLNLEYSTYLGGDDREQAYGIDVDSTGSPYLVGYTLSNDFPTVNPYQPSRRGWENVFISKFSSAGSILLYSTYLGGYGFSYRITGWGDYGYGITVENGTAYITGETWSSNFPTVSPYQSSHASYSYDWTYEDAFVSKLSYSGSALKYSSFLGGEDDDYGRGICVDGGAIYIAGYTRSFNFPIKNAYQPNMAGASDVFITKMSGSGSSLIYSTHLGGTGYEYCAGLYVENGVVYISGSTDSDNFPVVNPYQPSRAYTENDAFVAKLSSSGTVLLYSTYLGGYGYDFASGNLSVVNGEAYLAGYTGSDDFPTVNSYQPSRGGSSDGFAVKLSSTGSNLLYATYLGGTDSDRCASGISVDNGSAYLSGYTYSEDFPTANSYQSSHAGGWGSDLFVSKLDSSGSILSFSTYLGGADGSDQSHGICALNGAVYITGHTDSEDFPTVNSYQSSFAGGWGDDAFVSKLTWNSTPSPTPTPYGFKSPTPTTSPTPTPSPSATPTPSPTAAPTSQPQIWSGLACSFSKEDYADWTLPANQDQISTNVHLTRKNSKGIFNILLESGYQGWETSPLDTEWAFSGLNGCITFNQGEGTAQYPALTFAPFAYALDYNVGDYIEGTPGVLHLISENIYVDIVCTSWTSGSQGGGFAWDRACAQSPVPTPSTTAPIPTPTITPPCGNVPLFVHLTSDAWLAQTRSPNALGTEYCPWSDENGCIYDNENVATDWNCFSTDYSSSDFYLYAFPNEDVTPSAQAGDMIKMWYTETSGGPTRVIWIYLPDGAEWINYTDQWGYVTLYVDIDGNTYWDADLCETAYRNTAPTPPPSPTPTPPQFVIDSGDYNGDGTSDIAVFRQSSGLWSVKELTRNYFGASSDLPVSGDYDGDGTTDIAVFRPASGLWSVRGVTRLYYGSTSDIPIPGDYNGDGTCDTGIFRTTSGLWAIRVVTRIYYGSASDIPIPGDYDGDGTEDIAIFRSATGLWAGPGFPRIYFGGSGDQPVPGDYDGDGSWEPGIFRPTSGLWAVYSLGRLYYGSSADQPVPADYDGDLIDDIGIFRPTSGLWAIRAVSRVYYGSSGDIPATR